MVNYNDLKSVKEYMESRGVKFTGGNVDIGNAKGWAIMGGKSSLRILENARDGVNGISIMCYKDKEDCDRLCSRLNKEWVPNGTSDKTRLYKVPVAPNELDAVIEELLKNQKNTIS